MAPRLRRALAIAALSLSLSSIASAAANYSSVDMIRAQLALMDDRPKDCPPWCAAVPLSSCTVCPSKTS
jgi:hypothetical protein